MTSESKHKSFKSWRLIRWLTKFFARSRLLTLYRIFILGLQNFVRNSWLTFIALVMMTIAITFVLSGVILNITSKNVISDLSTDLQVSVYLNDDITEDNLAALRQALTSHEAVAEVTYISSLDAKTSFLASYEDDEKLTEAVALVGDQAFPASFMVGMEDLDQIDVVETIVNQDKYIDSVDSVSLDQDDARNTVSRANRIQNFLIGLSLVLALAFAVISMLVIFNTIRMAIFSRSEEVAIMRFIGAPTYFIKGPFLMESIFFGLISGGISVGLLYLTLNLFASPIQAVPEFVDSYQYFVGNTWFILMIGIGSIFGGILVSVLSCLWALQKYLKL